MASLAALSSIFSCTMVQEDRGGCPCWYQIDFSKVDPQIEKLHLWFFNDAGVLLRRDTLISSNYDDVYEIELERGRVGFYVWGNLSENTFLEDSLASTPILRRGEGAHADPLCWYGKLLDTDSEQGSDVVYVRREYADLSIVLKGGAADGQGFLIKLQCGTAGRYVDGSFLDEPVILQTNTVNDGANGLAHFRLFRQKSLHDLSMGISRLDDKDTYIVKDIPIGELMLKCGYDMQEEDLQDIAVVVDVAAGKVILYTEDWETVIYVDVIL